MADQTEQTVTTAPSINDERAQRRARRKSLIDQGINPYPIRSHIDAHAAELEERYVDLADGADTDDVVTVAGRIRAKRGQGKVSFLVLEDCTGQIQIFCRIDVLGEDNWGLLGRGTHPSRPALHLADQAHDSLQVRASAAR